MSDGPLPLSTSGKQPWEVAVQAATAAGTLLKNRFALKNHVQSKGKRNLVTESDLLAEESILTILKAEYPDHGVLCEESGKGETAGDYCWIIDPLDGTTNYAFGIPIFSVSIALTRRDEPVAGVVYDPMREELFRAQKGKGAFLNDSLISVAGCRNLQTTVIGLDLGYNDAKTREMLSRINRLWTPEISFRLIGSSALGLSYVAAGRLDIYMHRSIYPWDIAAAILLIREAGGEVTTFQGQPITVWDDNIFACSDIKLHGGVREMLAKSA